MAKADAQESSAASVSAGAEAPPPFVIDELAMALSSDIMLPMIEVPRPSGPGSTDPFGIMPPMLFVGYDHPLTVLDQFFGGGQSGGRTTFMDAYEGGFFRDLSIATSSDLTFITLRPTISAYAPPSPQEQAISRLFVKGVLTIGALLTPGTADELILAAGHAGSPSFQGVVAGEAGAFGALRARAVPGDMLTAHHMPQAALEFTTRAEGGSLVLPHSEHILTRTYGWRGGETLYAEQGMHFRDVLARDIRDIRRLFGPKYDPGLRDLLYYYKKNFPELMAR